MASKIGRNVDKCKRYRAAIGKPRGPGKTGNKSGKGYSSDKRTRQSR